MRTLMLFDKHPDVKDEIEAASKYFTVVFSEVSCDFNQKKPEVVIGRYSVMPFYRRMAKNLSYFNCYLINSSAQHDFIASFDYYERVKDLTPQSSFDLFDFYPYDGPFVLKGATKSKKHNWNTEMFAATRKDAIEVASRLNNDSEIGLQNILYRKYIPLKTFEIGINGVRYTNEWRFFLLRDQIVDYGYYWSSAEHPEYGYTRPETFKLVEEVAKRIHKHVNFWVMDVAETIDGNWILIELNDGQQSGLSEIPPERFYKNLSTIMEAHYGFK